MSEAEEEKRKKLKIFKVSCSTPRVPNTTAAKEQRTCSLRLFPLSLYTHEKTDEDLYLILPRKKASSGEREGKEEVLFRKFLLSRCWVCQDAPLVEDASREARADLRLKDMQEEKRKTKKTVQRREERRRRLARTERGREDRQWSLLRKLRERRGSFELFSSSTGREVFCHRRKERLILKND